MKKLKRICAAPLMLCGVIIAIYVIDFVLSGSLTNFGLRPRRLVGLLGIISSPFLHGSWLHLASNIVPLFVMGCMLSALNVGLFIPRTATLIILSGGLTWLVSSSGIVIGASGLVFAYWSFLIAHGLRTRTLLSVVFATLTIVLYGALLFALFKYTPGVSWAGHASGAVAGVLLAMISRKR